MGCPALLLGQMPASSQVSGSRTWIVKTQISSTVRRASGGYYKLKIFKAKLLEILVSRQGFEPWTYWLKESFYSIVFNGLWNNTFHIFAFLTWFYFSAEVCRTRRVFLNCFIPWKVSLAEKFREQYRTSSSQNNVTLKLRSLTKKQLSWSPQSIWS